jgi:hypothetical protein
MADYDDLREELKVLRDELALKMHLASLEVKDELHGLEEQLKEFTRQADMERTADDVGTALTLLGEELKQGYRRILNALRR